ncbi:MAG TPA: MaoC family dehydratase [Hyphomicrobiaceae bacterium]|nr:MaoC family dehydratase [Hyphomicrobiaceae bacterium]
MENAFDPDAHHIVPTRYFEDFEVGEVFRSPSRTLTDANFQVFQAASGDNHPIHYDREYCKRHGHRDLLAHGFQVLIQTCPGAGLLPHMLGPALVAFIEQSSKFLGPVYSGDTVYPALTLVACTPQRTTGILILRSSVHNQHRELVLEGEQKLLVRKRVPAAKSPP